MNEFDAGSTGFIKAFALVNILKHNVPSVFNE